MARPDSYSDEEKKFLVENYASMPWDDLIDGMYKISGVKRNKENLRSKAHCIGIRRSSVKCCLYTPEEDEMIREAYYSSHDGDIRRCMEMLIDKRMRHRSLSSVLNRVERVVGPGSRIRKPWTDEEIKYITENYYTMYTEDIATVINRTPTAVYNMVRKLGLKGAPRSVYSKEDERFVRDHYLEMSDEELGAVLHRAAQSIKEMRRKLKIYRKYPNAGTNYRSIMAFVQRHNSDWKKRSMEACGYKCVLTDGEFNDIHHLYAKNMILDSVLDKLSIPHDLDINNCDDMIKESILKEFFIEQDKYPLGACISEWAHHRFHVLYGFGNNTPEQFYEYAKMFPQNRLADIKLQ